MGMGSIFCNHCGRCGSLDCVDVRLTVCCMRISPYEDILRFERIDFELGKSFESFGTLIQWWSTFCIPQHTFMVSSYQS